MSKTCAHASARIKIETVFILLYYCKNADTDMREITQSAACATCATDIKDIQIIYIPRRYLYKTYHISFHDDEYFIKIKMSMEQVSDENFDMYSISNGNDIEQFKNASIIDVYYTHEHEYVPGDGYHTTIMVYIETTAGVLIIKMQVARTSNIDEHSCIIEYNVMNIDNELLYDNIVISM